MFKDFPAERLDRAIRLAGLRALTEEKGLDYRCGENGGLLSGGEKQRVSIARCLLRETPVLLADEATAALDNKTAEAVDEAILAIPDTTKIIVSHRYSRKILTQYDEIIVLKDGKCIERGSFGELMAQCAYFYSLFTLSGAE